MNYVSMNGVLTAVGALITFGGFWCIGHIVPNRKAWEYPLVGWAVVYLLSVLAALCGIADLRVVVAAAAVLLLTTLIWRRPAFRQYDVAAYLAAVPLLALSLLTPPVFEDSYMHWLPNASYLYQLDHFPKAPLGHFFSLHPTYPTALPLVIYISSLVTGSFVEMAGNVLNTVMLLVAMGCVWRLLWDCWPSRSGNIPSPPASRYLIAAIAFCATVPLNPAIEIEHLWSVIADPATGVLVLLIIAECCRYMTQERVDGEKTSLVVLFLLGCLAAGLKPGAWPLMVVLGTAAGLVGLLHRIPMRRWTLPAAAIVSGTLIATAMWKLYLAEHLPLPDQFVIRPLPDWSFLLWKDLLIAMLDILKTHKLYSLVVLATLAIGLLSLFRQSLIRNPTLRLMLGFASVAMILHLGSLYAAYLGSGFDDWMIRTASSFPRYTTHVGYAVCAIGLSWLSLTIVQPFLVRLSSVSPRTVAAACLIGCAALFSALTVRLTLELDDVVSDRSYRRKFALEALQEIRPGRRLAVAARKWSYNYLRYVIWADLDADTRPALVDHLFLPSSGDCESNDFLAGWMDDPTIDVILLVDAGEFAVRCTHSSEPDQVWRRSVGTWQVLNLDRPDNE